MSTIYTYRKLSYVYVCILKVVIADPPWWRHINTLYLYLACIGTILNLVTHVKWIKAPLPSNVIFIISFVYFIDDTLFIEWHHYKIGIKSLFLPGWTGNNCLTSIDDCQDSFCLNSATCEDLHNAYRCHCSEYYTGKAQVCVQTSVFCKCRRLRYWNRKYSKLNQVLSPCTCVKSIEKALTIRKYSCVTYSHAYSKNDMCHGAVQTENPWQKSNMQ